MRNLLLVLAFCLVTFKAFAVAPYGITGDKQTGTLYSNVHKAPNAQITNLGGINARIETGNKNILINPSFEHLVTDTGWTTTNGTVTSTVDALDGVKSASIALTGLLNFRQISTYSSNAGNLQGLISVWVKSSLADVYVCENHNNVEGLCVLYDGSNSWREMLIPTNLNASGSGFKIKTTSSTAGNIKIDDAFVGISKAVQDVVFNDSYSAHIITTSGTVSQLSKPNWISCTAANPTVCTFAAGTFTVAPNCVTTYTGAGGTTLLANINGNPSSTTVSIQTINSSTGADLATRDFTLICNKQGADAASKIYATSCGSDIACADEFSARVSSAGVVSEENLDWLNGNASVSGTSIYALTWNSSIFANSPPNCTATPENTTQATGVTEWVATSTTGGSWFTFHTQTEGALASAFKIKCQKTGLDYSAKRVIVGNFSEYNKTSGVSSPKLVSAKVSITGVVSSEMSDFITGNCAVTSTSTYTCTVPAGIFSVLPNCTATINDTDRYVVGYQIASSTVTSLVFITLNSNTAAAVAVPFSIICHGQ
jgi:hypothetical protein